MANLVQRFRRPQKSEQRFGMDWYLNQWMSITGNGSFPSGLNTTWGPSGNEDPPQTYEQYALSLFSADPVVFASVVTRMAVFSQAQLRYRPRNGRSQDLKFSPSLRKFERPWPGGTTSDLLGKMLVRADLGGNAYVWDDGLRLHVWRPEWVSIILGSDLSEDHPEWAEDVSVLGYLYHPGGKRSQVKPRIYMPDQVAHFAPIEDPVAHFRGMSWLTPVIREIQGDKAATEHKLKFFENAATPNLVIKFDPSQTKEQVNAFKELMEDDHQGVANAYKNLYLGGGADATVVGADFQQLDFASTQGKGETRIAMASGVHPTILGASEGMEGSSLNAGNYGQVKRLFADVRLQHLWRNAVASLEVLAPPPSGSELWFDTRSIPFLQDDLKDTAEIQSKQATAIKLLTDAGYEAGSIIDAVQADDFSLLQHTGLFSVQLQPPGTEQAAGAAIGEGN